MDNLFSIQINVTGEPMFFDARLDTLGFVHKIYVNISGIDVAFEPDEERNYRAIVKPANIAKLSEKDKEIIIAIAIALGKISLD